MTRERNRALLCLTACILWIGSAQAKAKGGTPLNLGVLAPLSGAQKNVGQDIRDAVSLCVEGAAGEFAGLGFKLGLKSFDDEHRDTVAKLRAEAMVKDSTLLVVVGSYSSSVSLTAAAIFSQTKLAIISPASTSTALTAIGLDNVNRIVAREDALSEAFATFLSSQLRATRVYLLQDDSAGASPLLEGVSSALQDKRVKVVGRSRTAQESNFSQVVADIQKNAPDVVFYAGEYAPAAGILKALRAAKLDMSFIGGDSLNDPSFKPLIGDAVRGIYVGSIAAPTKLFKAARAFDDAFKARFKRQVSGYGVLGFDACQVALEALRTVAKSNPKQTPTRAQVQSAVRKVNLKGQLSGNIQFDARGERLTNYIFFEQYGEDENLRVVQLLPVQTKSH